MNIRPTNYRSGGATACLPNLSSGRAFDQIYDYVMIFYEDKCMFIHIVQEQSTDMYQRYQFPNC